MKYINSYKFFVSTRQASRKNSSLKQLVVLDLVYNLFINSYNKLYADYKNGILTEKGYKEAKKRAYLFLHLKRTKTFLF